MPNPKSAKPNFRAVLGCSGILALAASLFLGFQLITNTFFADNTFWLDSSESAISTTQKFVNSRQGLDGDRLQHYVDFSFQYPQRWQLETSQRQPGKPNYVTVSRCPDRDAVLQQSCPIPIALFAVGPFWGTEEIRGNEPQFQEILRQHQAQRQLKIPAYQKISSQKIKLGTYTGYEIRYVGKNVQYQANGQNLMIWGRDIFLPDGNGNGVLLMTVATSLSTEVKQLEDLETQGELPLILKSFKFTAIQPQPASGFFF